MNPTFKPVSVRVPSSSANLGPGFDCIGLALQRYVHVLASPSEELSITYESVEANGSLSPERQSESVLKKKQSEKAVSESKLAESEVPLNEDNLVYQMMKLVFEKAGRSMPPVQLCIRSSIPLTRGLGSSAAAIVGGMFAANAMLGGPFSTKELYTMSTAVEDHPDNVGASIYGNIVIASWDGQDVYHINVQPPEELRIVAAIPDFSLPTKEAREVVPSHISRKDAVHNIGCSSLLVASLLTGHLDGLKHALRDKLHQPYRMSLVPGMSEIVRDIAQHGAFGAVLSGAGPTLLALCTEQHVHQVRQYLSERFEQQPFKTEVTELLIDREGVQIQNTDEKTSPCTIDRAVP